MLWRVIVSSSVWRNSHSIRSGLHTTICWSTLIQSFYKIACPTCGCCGCSSTSDKRRQPTASNSLPSNHAWTSTSSDEDRGSEPCLQSTTPDLVWKNRLHSPPCQMG